MTKTEKEQQEAARLKYEGHSRAEIARIMGLTERQVKTRLARRDPAIQTAMDTIGTGMEPSTVWVKTDGYSVMLRPSRNDDNEIEAATDSAIQRIQEVNVNAPYIARPKATDENLFGFLPLFDAHIGLSMPGYGLQDAVERLVDGAMQVIDYMPQASELMILNGGDFTHQNDESNQTPRSKHPLPVDGLYDDATDAGTDALIQIIEYAAKRFEKISHKSLAGNHDPATAKIIRAALRQRYRDVDCIDVDIDGTHFWKRVFGKNMLTAQHGDIRRGQKDIIMGISAHHAVEWGQTTHREHHTGHLHHIKQTRFDDGGMTLCQHAAISPMSDHDIHNLYAGTSILQGITYRASGGRHSTFEVSLGDLK